MSYRILSEMTATSFSPNVLVILMIIIEMIFLAII